MRFEPAAHLPLLRGLRLWRFRARRPGRLFKKESRFILPHFFGFFLGEEWHGSWRWNPDEGQVKITHVVIRLYGVRDPEENEKTSSFSQEGKHTGSTYRNDVNTANICKLISFIA